MRWAGIVIDKKRFSWVVETGTIGLTYISCSRESPPVEVGMEVVMETFRHGDCCLWRIIRAKRPVDRAKSLALIRSRAEVWPCWAGTTDGPVEG